MNGGGAGKPRSRLRSLIQTQVLALLLLCLLLYNGSTMFWLLAPPRDLRAALEVSPVTAAAEAHSRKSTALMSAVKEETPAVVSTTHQARTVKRVVRRGSPQFKTLRLEARPKRFAARVTRFFQARNGSDPLCEPRFFMTWISSIDSFGARELFSMQSLFNSNPRACLVVISSSMDSKQGVKILKPFVARGFRVIPVAPDFAFLFRNTQAESWFDNLRRGQVNPGDIALGQNISNLLRLALLYKFGGVYVDTDVIILRSFSGLRNVIGAQAMNSESRNWTRLNNAVMVFDKKHRLLYEFIKEFALTFDGNKWGHNGPYLVSRVVSRVAQDENWRKADKSNFTVLPSQAFYPMDWSRVGSLFRGPGDEKDSKWVSDKLRQIYAESFAIHLWNRQSKKLRIEDGSIIGRVAADHCLFCKDSGASPAL
uniref:Alpha 1,4-glycosyltransferase domain-containing protein n=1 Tax=Kalanchoe fedtschenkoi TaxID=63787 RepID=A0A7N0V1E4_KALFE